MFFSWQDLRGGGSTPFPKWGLTQRTPSSPALPATLCGPCAQFIKQVLDGHLGQWQYRAQQLGFRKAWLLMAIALGCCANGMDGAREDDSFGLRAVFKKVDAECCSLPQIFGGEGGIRLLCCSRMGP